jgi:hypothetical protein
MAWAWVMFCALDIHRKNINRAISDNMVNWDKGIRTRALNADNRSSRRLA